MDTVEQVFLIDSVKANDKLVGLIRFNELPFQVFRAFK